MRDVAAPSLCASAPTRALNARPFADVHVTSAPPRGSTSPSLCWASSSVPSTSNGPTPRHGSEAPSRRNRGSGALDPAVFKSGPTFWMLTPTVAPRHTSIAAPTSSAGTPPLASASDCCTYFAAAPRRTIRHVMPYPTDAATSLADTVRPVASPRSHPVVSSHTYSSALP